MTTMNQDRHRLDGKVAVVTGGGRGIGAAAAWLLAERGAHVVVVDNGVSVDGHHLPGGASVASQICADLTDKGYSAQAHAADASDVDVMADLVETVAGQRGAPDIVVAGAGTLRVRPIWEMTADDWQSVMSSHVTHTFAIAQPSCRLWRQRYLAGDRRGGRLVTMVAATGLVGRPDLGANHAAAKGAVAAMTLELAHEMFPYEVTVNAVCAANVRGRMADHVGATIPQPRDGFDPGDPRHSAQVISYLASDDAAWLTGQVIRSIGGLIGRYEPWRVTGSLDRSDGWDLDELRLGVRRLYQVYPETLAIHGPHRPA